jgi:hypothetical protein
MTSRRIASVASAEQAGAALCRHAMGSELGEVIETLLEKPLSLRRGKPPVTSGDAGESQAEDAPWLLRGEAGGDQSPERLPDQMAAIDAKRGEPRIERRRIIARIGMVDCKPRRSAIAGGIPGGYPKSRGQRLHLVSERRGGRPNTVQQDKRRAAAGLQIGEDGVPGLHSPAFSIGNHHAI